MLSTSYDPFLDELLWGAAEIAQAARIFHKDGTPNDKKANRLIVAGVIPAQKKGGRWLSTRRQILSIARQPEPA